VSVFLSTAYLDEAERCERVVVLHNGEVLGEGAPGEFRERASGRTFAGTSPEILPRRLQSLLRKAPGVVDAALDRGRVRVVTGEDGSLPRSDRVAPEYEPLAPRFEDAFMILLRQGNGRDHEEEEEKAEFDPGADALAGDRKSNGGEESVVAVRDLVRRFGDFTAVRRINFEVRRGEIFGLLGPNGAGKSTTFRMLCGLLPPSEGSLHVAGADLRRAAASARRRIGYVAQKFSQYGQLTVGENLRFFSSAYDLRGKHRRERIDWALEEFGLTGRADQPARDLPLGYKQRLAMACALMHRPEILFLDEPTSGVDPLARREFWDRIGALADGGVTVIVTTHFLEEAEYCDRLAIMVAGELLATGTAQEVRREAGEGEGEGEGEEGPAPSIEDAFITLVESRRQKKPGGETSGGDAR
jgi:ABC-2 type transport system ATP-binding protein